VRSAGIINHHLTHAAAGKKQAQQEGSVDSCEGCLAVRCTTNAKWLVCLLFLIALAGTANAHTLITTSNYSRTVGERTDGTFYVMRNDAGDFIDGDVVDFCGYTVASTTTNIYTENWRCAIRFDTSSLGSTAIITSVKLSVRRSTNWNQLAPPNPSIQFIDFSPASSSVFAGTDYSKTTYAPTTDSIGIIAYDGMTWANFTLNVAGLAAINKTGFTTMLGDSSNSISNTSPTWASGGFSGFRIQSSAGTYKPFLTIEYTLPASVASFTADNETPCSTDTVTFTDTSTNTPTVWDWRWWSNETTSSTLQNPTYQFPPGLYNVRLYASNADGGDWENKTAFINSTDCTPPITSPIDASFTSNVTCGNIPFTVQFNDTSSGTPTIWNWSFGDGNYSVLQNPVFEYNLSGLYTINFSANNGNADWMNRSEYIRAVPNWASCPPTPTPMPTWGPEIMPSTDNEIASPSWVDYMISLWWIWLLLVVGYILVKK
jgi:PKD repeat protein